MSSRITIYICLFSICVARQIDARNPGIKLYFSEQLINYYAHTAETENFHDFMDGLEIADIQKEKNVGVFGKFDYQLYDMKLGNVLKPIFYVSLHNGQIEAKLDRCFIDLTGKYKLKYFYMRTSGQFTDKICLNITLTFKPSESFGLQLVTCNSKPVCKESLEIIPDTKLPDWTQKMLDMATTDFGSILSGRVCDMLSTKFRTNPCFGSTPCSKSLAVHSTRMRIKEDPIGQLQITDQGIIGGIDGTTILEDYNTITPIRWTPQPMPNINLVSHQLTVALNTYTINTAIDAYCSAGLLDKSLDPSQFPPDDDIYFATCCQDKGHCYGSFVKGICEKYRDKFLQVSLKPTGVLSNTILETGMTTTIGVNAYFTLNGTLQFTTQLNVTAATIPYFANGTGKICGKVSSITVRVGKSSSDTSMANLLDYFGTALNRRYFTPFIQGVMNDGADLNRGGWKSQSLIRNPTIQLKQDVAIMRTEVDVTFDRP